MAEFQEVCKQWRRMCRDGSKDYSCADCKMYSSIDESVCRGIPNEDDAKVIESFVMSWAAEHPVVYPTWADYISTLVIKDICTGKISGPDTVLTYAMKTRIPADIADKLGIEPKEDV